MKTFFRYLPVVVLAALLGTACTEDKVGSYSSPRDNVFFDFEQNPLGLSVSFSFADFPGMTEQQMSLPVRLSGRQVDYDRYFRVIADTIPRARIEALAEQNIVVTPAVAETHFAPLAEEYLFSADRGVVGLPITILNDPATMDTGSVILKLTLVPSDDFDVSFRKGDTELYSMEIIYSNQLLRPDWWTQGVQGSLYTSMPDYTRTGYELFRISTGYMDLPLIQPGEVTPTMQLIIIESYKAFLADPMAWQDENSESYSIDTGEVVDGHQTYFLYDNQTPNAKRYEFRQNNDSGVYQFMDENGGYSIQTWA